MHQAHELWMVLRNVTNPGKDLKELVDYLDASCRLFRMALEAGNSAGQAAASKGMQ